MMARDKPLTEQELRAALRPLGFRLSQRNAGFVVLDGNHRYVTTGHEVGGEPEVALEQVALWLATAFSRGREQLCGAGD